MEAENGSLSVAPSNLARSSTLDSTTLHSAACE